MERVQSPKPNSTELLLERIKCLPNNHFPSLSDENVDQFRQVQEVNKYTWPMILWRTPPRLDLLGMLGM